MQKTFTVLFILFVLVLGVVFFMDKGKLEAPAVNDNTVLNIDGTVNSEMPVPTEDNTIPEMVVDSTGVKEFTVEGVNFSFNPKTITVNKGDQVRIIFKNTAGFHDFKIDEFSVAAKQMQSPYQEILEFTADKAGSFQYYCSVGSHRAAGMFGTLTVQ